MPVLKQHARGESPGEPIRDLFFIPFRFFLRALRVSVVKMFINQSCSSDTTSPNSNLYTRAPQRGTGSCVGAGVCSQLALPGIDLHARFPK